MNWTDATTYSRGNTDKKQDSWEMKSGQIRIWISTGHTHYHGKWVMTCHVLRIDAFAMKIPGEATPEQAQELAVRIVKNRLETMLKSLDQ